MTKRSARLAELLETSDPATQAERVETLMQAAAVPVWSMALHYDPRTDGLQVAILGPGQPPWEVCHLMLERARQAFVQREREAIAQARDGEASE